MKYVSLAKGLLIALLLTGGQVIAQKSNNTKNANRAEKLFQFQSYHEALPLFLELEKTGTEIDHLNYKIAKCLFESDEVNDKVRSLDYFEKVKPEEFEELPRNFYQDLGDAFFADEQIEQALLNYNKHLNFVRRDKRALALVNRKIETAKRAFKLMRIPKNVYIKNLGESINSKFTEYNPVVSADESVMAFTLLQPVESKTGERLAEEILISYNKTGAWSIPEKVIVKTENNYGTAGLSADGQEMMIFIGDRSSGSIYKIRKEEDAWSRPVPVFANIQSRYMESTASITPDNQTIYFASNKPGGYGGMDIYKAEKRKDGTWGKPVNLGPSVNTRANEDAPFIHPNKKFLFFTTDGHNGMGGNDIYKTELIDGQWTEPKNMGYPINTTANDNYFTLIADGARGYFSSDRKGGYGGQDIYAMDMPEGYETIPLTMIKGKILDAETGKAPLTSIYIIDSKTSEKIDWVYHPNKETGEYLVILPPNKSYDMIIESEGYLPYTLNIDVPNQTEFYELYQKIYLKTIKQFDVVVGQEIEVKNAFYNTQKDQVASLRKVHEAALIEHDSIDVYELMSDLIEAGDQAAIDYLVELIMVKNPIEDVDFDNENEKIQSAKRRYYYDESDESKFEVKKVDGEVIYSLPTMFVTKEAEEQKNSEGVATIANKPTTSNVLKVYFNVGKSDLSPKSENDLNGILNRLKENDDLGVEISGFASSEGDEEYNKKLSNQRAISVLDYLNHRGIVRRRIVAKGYGETHNQGVSKEESRRVEVRIIDLNDLPQ